MQNHSSFSLKARIQSFAFAFAGLFQLICKEHNARIHLLATAVVITAGLWLHISRTDWLAVVMATGLVWCAEAFNSAIEKLTDQVSPEWNVQAKYIKDVAAAAVLIAAITAVVVACLVFIPRLKTL
ncbi:diacylglycerol kinase family protein [Thermoflavifilum thermophilum]|uniref:Diacylglycerol kinase (ATP) n=1 Tax=Thermoflavifilum thermophilum TaxID=1393122 RepID=A0A1I7N8D3_9BACT|nr:diacylglycerol kinase family protein [Thermoflavifilum thermophilum]SFV30944.1 diacylglycerol kinase (ATP) [Thermoflavifilum thermophilum]